MTTFDLLRPRSTSSVGTHSTGKDIASRHLWWVATLFPTRSWRFVYQTYWAYPRGMPIRGLGSARMGSMRGEFRRIGGLTVIVDCYNANPQSVRASLDILEDQAVASRKVAVLGTMLELGEASDRLHADVLKDVLARPIDLVVATGGFHAAAAALEVDDDRIVAADAWQDAYPLLRDRLEGEEVVLLKASRGIALERVLPMLDADFGPGLGLGSAEDSSQGGESTPRAVEA